MKIHALRRGPVLTIVVGIVVTAILLFPLYWMLVNSLETTQEMFSIPAPLVPTTITFAPYVTVLQSQLPHLLTSLIVAFGTVILSLVIATPSAYALAHLTRPFGADELYG